MEKADFRNKCAIGFYEIKYSSLKDLYIFLQVGKVLFVYMLSDDRC